MTVAAQPTEGLLSKKRVRKVFALALPIIGGMLSQNVLNLIDTAMVGRLGAAAIGAVGFGGIVNWLCSAFFLAMGAGVQTIAARRVGEGNRSGAIVPLNTALAICLLCVLPYGLLLSTLTHEIYTVLSGDPAVIAEGAPYLQVRMWAMMFTVINFSFRGYWNGIGRSRIYLHTIVAIHVINVFLNWVLIYGNLGFEPMGVKGAGVASACAVVCGSLIYFSLAWRHARQDGFLARNSFSFEAAKAVMRLSVPMGIQNFFLSAGYTAFYRIAQVLGTSELAATTVIVNLAMVCMLPSVGFGLAATTLVGQALGGKSPKEAERWGWTVTAISSITLAGLGLVLASAPRLWLSALTPDLTVVTLGVFPLLLVAFSQPFSSVGMVLSQALIGAGAVRPVAWISITMQWVFFLPIAYLVSVTLEGGLLALWTASCIWRISFSFAMTALFRSDRWKNLRV